MPGQPFVHLVAQKPEDVQPPGAVLHQTPGADQVFQPAHEHQLEEDHRVERGLARGAVEAPRFRVEKALVDPLGQPAVEIMAPHPFTEPKAGHRVVEK